MTPEQHSPQPDSAPQQKWEELSLPTRQMSALAIYQSPLWTISFCSPSFREWTGGGAYIDHPFFEFSPHTEGVRPTQVDRIQTSAKGQQFVHFCTEHPCILVPEAGAMTFTVTDPERSTSESRSVPAGDSLFIRLRAGLQISVTSDSEGCSIRRYW